MTWREMMMSRYRGLAFLFLALAFPGLAGAATADAADAYAPLRLYQGRWQLTPQGASRPLVVDNHCARTGLFFSCEQIVDGKPVALVVFQPVGGSAERFTYRSQALRTDDSDPSPWSELIIEGSHWTYLSRRAGRDGTLRQRTLNVFSGPDRIHYTVQHSPDGLNWITDGEGDEQRL